MPATQSPPTLSDSSIHLINSLGGPPLPTGMSKPSLKVLIENLAASEVKITSCRIATSLSQHRP